ncbi:hypothetical protein ACFY4B_27155 [Kitasatospora sp. NPDC001261]|uniref:hypothetical protein n=1 Tax=Kitasatospora sp. NPDC001261 TaxID=3364012 RepID=UPI00367BF235
MSAIAPSRAAAALFAVPRPAAVAPRPLRPAGTPLRVVALALSRTTRMAAQASSVARRLARLGPDVDVVGGSAHCCTPAQACRLLGTDADLLYACGHHCCDPVQPQFLGLDLHTASWAFPSITAPALVLDTCCGAEDDLLGAIAAARPRQLPPAVVFTTDAGKVAPFSHDVLFRPLLQAALTGGRPACWQQRLEDAMAQARASKELQSHTLRDWDRWGVHQVQGTR